MTKRAVGGLLWFLAISSAYEFLWALTGVPHDLGTMFGLLAAGIVVVDPTGQIWGHTFKLNNLSVAPRREASLEA